MANILEKAILILAGNLNSGLSYPITIECNCKNTHFCKTFAIIAFMAIYCDVLLNP